LRDPAKPYLPSIQTPIDAIYWGAAVVGALIVGFDLLPWPISFVVLLGIGIGVSIIGWRIEGGVAEHRPTGWLWSGIFLVVWLAIALIRRSFPFGP